MPASNKIQVGYIEAQDGAQFQVDAGTAAAPGLVFDDSLATGLYSPGTGQIAWSTSGKQTALRILADGKVGVDCSPTVAFEVNGTIKASAIDAPIEGTLDDWIVHAGDTNTKFGFPAADTFSVETGGAQRVAVNNTTGVNTLDVSGGARADYFVGRSNVSTPTADVSIYRVADNTLEFATASTPRLRITSAGAIQCKGETDVQNSIFRVTDGTPRIIMSVPSGGLDTRLFNDGSGNFIIGHGTNSDTPTERLRIDSHGCVRVGNTATQSTSSNTKRIALGAKGSIQGWVSGQLNGCVQLLDNYYWDGSNNKAIEADHCGYLSLRSGSLRFGSTNSTQTAGQNVSGGIHERLRIDSSGHMGLGITPSDIDSIGRALNIASSTGGAIYLQDTDAPTTKFAAISYNGGTAGLQIHAHHGSSFIDLGTGGTPRIRIDSSGRVIIGDTDNANAHANADNLIIGNTGNDERSGLTIVSDTDKDGAIHFSDGAGAGQLRGQIVYGHTWGSFNDVMVLYTAGTKSLHIQDDGDVILGEIGGTTYTESSTEAQLRVVGDASASRPGAISLMGFGNTSNAAHARINFQQQTSGTNGQTTARIEAINRSGAEDASDLAFYTEKAGSDLKKSLVLTNKGEALLYKNASDASIGTATNLSFDSLYLGIGETEGGNNVYRTIGFGYRTNTTSEYPASIGCQITDWSANTKAELVFATRNTTGQADVAVERLRIESGGTIRTIHGVQSGGNATGGFKFNANYSGKGFDIATQYATQGNGGSNGNDPMFSGWWGATNTFRVNSSGQIKFGASLNGQVQSGSFSVNAGATKTVTVSGMVSGAFIFQGGTYSSSGQGQGGIHFTDSGYHTAPYTHDIHEIKKWSNGGGSGISISSVSKNASSSSFTVSNSHGSFNAGFNWHLWGNDEVVVTIS